mmetsp:Transcript_90183/g.156146  ORF Transcript_90183/g.156146 Transcript_90183/m.156146 type:complete len:244 (+) Transcript_90183:280-1011(+)
MTPPRRTGNLWDTLQYTPLDSIHAGPSSSGLNHSNGGWQAAWYSARECLRHTKYQGGHLHTVQRGMDCTWADGRGIAWPVVCGSERISGVSRSGAYSDLRVTPYSTCAAASASARARRGGALNRNGPQPQANRIPRVAPLRTYAYPTLYLRLPGTQAVGLGTVRMRTEQEYLPGGVGTSWGLGTQEAYPLSRCTAGLRGGWGRQSERPQEAWGAYEEKGGGLCVDACAGSTHDQLPALGCRRG